MRGWIFRSKGKPVEITGPRDCIPPMVRLVPLLVLLCVAAISAWAWLRKPEPAVLNPSPAQSVEIAPVVKEVPYTTGPASADGIGKFFHGREISAPRV